MLESAALLRKEAITKRKYEHSHLQESMNLVSPNFLHISFIILLMGWRLERSFVSNQRNKWSLEGQFLPNQLLRRNDQQHEVLFIKPSSQLLSFTQIYTFLLIASNHWIQQTLQSHQCYLLKPFFLSPNNKRNDIFIVCFVITNEFISKVTKAVCTPPFHPGGSHLWWKH